MVRSKSLATLWCILRVSIHSRASSSSSSSSSSSGGDDDDEEKDDANDGGVSRTKTNGLL